MARDTAPTTRRDPASAPGRAIAPTASSGLPALDDALGGLFWGDNVVVLAPTAPHAAAALAAAAIAAPGYGGRVGIAFGGALPVGLDVEDVAGSDVDAAIARILACGAALGAGGLIVVDDLAHAVERWGVDGARSLFTRSCPALLGIGAVAYWTLGPGVPDDLVADVRRITQIVLAVDDERLVVDRAEARPPSAVGSAFTLAVGADGAVGATPLGDGARIGVALTALRAQRGLTQSAVARLAGVSPSAISQAERGARGLSVDTLVRLAAGLGVTLDELVLGPRDAGYRIRGRTAPHRGGASRVALLDGRDEPLRVYEFRLDPGAHGSPPARAGGAEAVLLGQGLLLLTMTDGSTPVIREGEALFAGSAAIADWRNLADGQAVGFWVGA